MTTQPDVEQNGALVRRSIWQFFCDTDAAQGMLQKVKALVHDAKIVDGNDTFFGGGLTYKSDRVRAWFVQGTVVEGKSVYKVDEALGALLDREKTPNPFVDTNPDTSLGGTKLRLNKIGEENMELSWCK